MQSFDWTRYFSHSCKQLFFHKYDWRALENPKQVTKRVFINCPSLNTAINCIKYSYGLVSRTGSIFLSSVESIRRFDSAYRFLRFHFNVILNHLSAKRKITSTLFCVPRTHQKCDHREPRFPCGILCPLSNRSVHFPCRKGDSGPVLTSLSHIVTNMHRIYISISL